MFTCDILNQAPTIKHAFFSRKGGVSDGIYQGLNVGYGSDDLTDKVTENRKRAMKSLGQGEDSLCTVHQIHSSKVIRIEEKHRHENAPQADGMVTNVPGLVLGILTADCAPVLFADPVNKVVGAAHAGWKGAGLNIMQETVTEMLKIGAETRYIHAVVGPCIQWDSYEVGPDFPEKFLECNPLDKEFFKPSPKNANHFMFNLPGYIEKKLGELQLKSAVSLGRDTVTDEENFFSYRRKTLRGEPDYGRQLSAIMVEE